MTKMCEIKLYIKKYYNMSMRVAVFEMPYYHTTLPVSAVSRMYTAHSIHNFCMHGIPG